jgi:DNA-binding MarR family transcriptional regulator
MAQEAPRKPEVDQFILEEIESVSHLEALLLIWRSRPKSWAPEDMAKALYVSSENTLAILRDLESRQLVSNESGNYFYQSNLEGDDLIEELDRVYRRELIRVSNMIHSKASPSVRAFARAFRLKKD